MSWSRSRKLQLGAASLVASLALVTTACDQVQTVGEVHNPTAVINRDGAASGLVGGKVLWVFGDTFTSKGGVRNSAAYATVSNPTQVSEPLKNGVPSQLVPFTADEAKTNALDGRDGNKGQWVIWPASVVPTSANSALVFSSKFFAGPTSWSNGSLVVSTVNAGSTVSTRVAEPLKAPLASYAISPYLDHGYVYLHECGGVSAPPEISTGTVTGVVGTTTNPAGRCRIGRVPVAKVGDGTAYRYWTGLTWSASQADAVATVPGSNSGLSVAWSESFGSYIALTTPGYSKEIQLSTAPKPEGPWTKPRTVFTAETDVYAVQIHPELSSKDLATVSVSYFRQDQTSKPGGIVLTNMTLSKG
jgi:hypothetical protein